MPRDPLDDLLDQVLGRTVKREKVHAPKKLPVPKQEKIYFDADRFRFYFDGRGDLSLKQWRDILDEEMRNAEEP
jgi:hypothetical protein